MAKFKLLQKERKKGELAVVLAVVFLIAVMVVFLFKRNEERTLEMADLQAMRSAEAAALLEWKNAGPLEHEEYWYDAWGYRLYPATEEKPAGFGAGTTRRGGAVRKFKRETGKEYEYSEGQSYRGLVLFVTVENMDGEPLVTVNWVA